MNKIKAIFIIFVLSLGCTFELFAEQGVFQKATSLVEKQKYEEAIVLLVDFIYENPDKREIVSPLLNQSIEMKLSRDIDNSYGIRKDYLAKADIILQEQRRKQETMDNLKKKYNSFDRGRQYFNATAILDEMQGVMPEDPFMEKARLDIITKMSNNLASSTVEVSAQNYAQAYLSFIKGDARKSVQFLNSFNMLSPNNVEVTNYIRIIENNLRFEKVNKQLFEDYTAGKKAYDGRSYKEAYTKFQSVVELFEKYTNETQFVSYNENRYTSAKGYMTKLQAVFKSPPKRVETVTTTEKSEIDPEKSEKLYRDGLNSYTQGRIKEAILKWEASLRYNPNNQKAKAAIVRAKKEL